MPVIIVDPRVKVIVDDRHRVTLVYPDGRVVSYHYSALISEKQLVLAMENKEAECPK